MRRVCSLPLLLVPQLLCDVLWSYATGALPVPAPPQRVSLAVRGTGTAVTSQLLLAYSVLGTPLTTCEAGITSLPVCQARKVELGQVKQLARGTE